MITPEQARTLMSDAITNDILKVDEAVRRAALKGENTITVAVVNLSLCTVC